MLLLTTTLNYSCCILVVMLESGIFAVAKFSSVKPLTAPLYSTTPLFKPILKRKKLMQLWS